MHKIFYNGTICAQLHTKKPCYGRQTSCLSPAYFFFISAFFISYHFLKIPHIFIRIKAAEYITNKVG